MTMTSSNRSNRARGFTLIELMIALAVVAILAAIAYPSYTEHVIKTKRTEGRALLNRIAAEQERFFTARNQYAASVTAARPAGLGLTATSEKGCYLAAVAVTNGGMGYNLTAVPQNSAACGDQTQDTKCGTLGINSLGVKTATGTLGAAGCW
jgi:type IV pilus assembly protein PilE